MYKNYNLKIKPKSSGIQVENFFGLLDFLAQYSNKHKTENVEKIPIIKNTLLVFQLICLSLQIYLMNHPGDQPGPVTATPRPSRKV